jgi:PAS domain S-box-containing protein
MKDANFKLWKDVVENLDEAVHVINRDFKIVLANRRLAELVGLQKEEITGKKLFELFPAEKGVEREYLEVFNSGEGLRTTERMVFGGKEYYMRTTKLPLDLKGERLVLTIIRDVTDEELAKKEILKLKNFSDSIFESISTGIMVLDRDFKIRAMNAYQVEHMRRFGKLNINREEVIGKHFSEISTLLEEEHRGESFRELFRRVLEQGEVIKIYNHEHRSKAGATVYLNFTLQPLRGAGGEIEGVVLLSEDATEKAMLEQEVEQSRDFLKRILESLGQGVVVVDREFRILMCNTAYTEMAGLSREEIIGKKCYEVAHLRQWSCAEERELCPAVEVFSTGKPVKVVHEHRRKDGSSYYAEVNAYPLRNDRGEVVQVIEMVNDITERYELEKKLRETRDFLNNIVKSSGDAIVATDLEGRITFWSQGAENLFGYKAKEMLGGSIYDLYPEEFKVKRKRMEEFLLEYPENAIRNYRMKIYKKDGKLVDISLSLSLLKDAKGEPIGMVGISKDITREVKAEEELKRKIRELEDFYNMAIGREIKMIELKNEIERLREEIRRLRGEA